MAHTQAIENLMARYADLYRHKDAPGLTALYADDAVIYTSFGPPVRGRAAILAEHAAWLAQDEDNKSLRILDLCVEAELATCVVEFSADRADGSGPETGVSVNVLRKDPAAGWLIRTTSLILGPPE